MLPEEKISDGEQRAQQPICLIVTVAHWGPRLLWVYCLCCRKSSHSVLAAESCRIPSVEVRQPFFGNPPPSISLCMALCSHSACRIMADVTSVDGDGDGIPKCSYRKAHLPIFAPTQIMVEFRIWGVANPWCIHTVVQPAVDDWLQYFEGLDLRRASTLLGNTCSLPLEEPRPITTPPCHCESPIQLKFTTASNHRTGAQVPKYQTSYASGVGSVANAMRRRRLSNPMRL